MGTNTFTNTSNGRERERERERKRERERELLWSLSHLNHEWKERQVIVESHEVLDSYAN